MKTYWTSVEFNILEPALYENCIGGFVYLFFQAKDVLEAIPIITKEIENEGFTVNQIEFVTEYENVSWETPEDKKKYDGMAKQASSKGKVIWDEIEVYEADD